MLVAAAIAALVLLSLNKGGGGAQQQQKKKTPDTQDTSGGLGDAGKIAGSAIGVATTAVGLLKASGLVAGGGTAAGTGGTSAAAGGATAATGGGAAGGEAAASSSAAFAGYEGVSVGAGLGIGASIGVAAIIAAVEAAIVITWWFTFQWMNQRAVSAITFAHPPNVERWYRDLCSSEISIVNAMVDPTNANPAVESNGKPVTPSLVTDRRHLWLITKSNIPINNFVPVGIALSAAETLKLWRIARWAAIEKLRAGNATLFAFWESISNPDIPTALVALPPGMLEVWLSANFNGGPEPYEDPVPPPGAGEDSTGYGIGLRLGASVAELDGIARTTFGKNYQLWKDLFHFQGVAQALNLCGGKGYGPNWPGEETFTREVVRRTGIGWDVQQFLVGAGIRWLAVDPTTHYAVDIAVAHQAGIAKAYQPASLGTPLPPGPYTTQNALGQAPEQLVATAAPSRVAVVRR
jgi:hypothetical protein